jgi:hypothetical protein
VTAEAASQYLVSFNAAIAEAESKGFAIVRGDSRTLLLDLDTADDIKHFARVHGALKSFLKFTIVERWPSKSGAGEHVVIKIDRDLSAMERVLLQACLGSDRLHEMLSLATGLWQGNTEPTVLFRPTT